jgi:RNA polymerase sigma-70 factor (ECF subfamily)
MTSNQYFLAVTAIQNRLHAFILSLLAEQTERRIQILGGCVERLSDDHKTLLHKRYGRETSIATLAEDSGKTTSAMKQMLYRIRNLLAACVEECLQKGTAG